MSVRQQQIADVLLALLPMDGSMVGNASLFDQLKEAGRSLGLRVSDDDFQVARQRMQAEMDRSIAAHADSETLYDQPQKAKNKLRITGPFSVEAVPFPTVLSLDTTETSSGPEFTADAAVARSGATSRHAQWRS